MKAAGRRYRTNARVSEHATLKRRKIREHQIVNGVHEGCGRRGFGLCPHPAKCNPSENCCVEAEASPARRRGLEKAFPPGLVRMRLPIGLDAGEGQHPGTRERIWRWTTRQRWTQGR